MSPKAAKITSGSSRGNRQGVIDAPHGKHAHRAARPVNQFDICRQNIFQAEAINRVCVAAADFHQPVVALRVGQAANFFRGLR